MAEITQKLVTPRVPNFIMIEGPTGRRQDGFIESTKVSIADLADDQLLQIAEDWKSDLIARAQDIRLDRRFDAANM